MPSITSQIESILFVASRPMSIEEIAKNIDASLEEMSSALKRIKEKYNTSESGIHIIDNGYDVQMVTNPENVEFVEKITTKEVKGELTRAQLETLTVIAYQCPITRPELEQLRGVNCSVILRNLQMRGLIDEDEAVDAVVPSYRVSAGALRFLGINSPMDLPNYSELRDHPHIKQILSGGEEGKL